MVMHAERPDQKTVTLTLQDATGLPWPLTMSVDCLRFVGRYRRIDGFCVDAMILFEGVRKAG